MKLPEYTNSQIAFLIDERIHSERDRRIMRAVLIDGVRLEPLAEMMELSPRQIKRIVYKNEQELIKFL